MGDLASVFESLLDIPEAERVLRLQAQAMHPEDRLLLQRMLDVDARDAPRFLDQPAVQHAQVLREEQEAHVPPESLVGQQFGAFRLERLVGQGGMATVFQARRVGADFEQTVAVKLLRRGLFSAVEQKLFLRERRLLANLSHPYIARMIDGGVTQAGVPYLVLEYVRGLRLDEYVARRRLDLRARLELFARVASAVEAAHQALIVHRDLKPSNVLVTADGTPKLLDFGVAKLLDEDASHQTLTTAMTPSYAAPEQLSGAPITTAADVYALGVILHELLTGRRPRGPDGSPASTSMAGAGGASARPETQAQLSRLMRGDLDNIVRRALEEQPSRRYASAAALVDDVHRYLQGRPVLAHAPSRWYVFRKFVRRNRVAAGLTLALVTAVAASIAGSLWQARATQVEAARANAVRDLLMEVFRTAEQSQPEGSRASPEDIVESGMRRVLGDTVLPDESRLEFIGVLATVASTTGAYVQMDHLTGEAVRIADRLYRPGDLRWIDTRRQRAQAMIHLNRADEAVKLLRPWREELLAIDQRAAYEALLVLGVALDKAGADGEDGKESTSLLKALRERAERSPVLPPDVVLHVMISEADQLASKHHFRESLERASAAEKYWRDRELPLTGEVLWLYEAIGNSASSLGDAERGEAAYRNAITLSERLHDRPHSDTAWFIGLLGSYLVSLGRVAEAEPYVVKGLEMRRETAGPNASETLFAVGALARLRALQQRQGEAIALLDEAIAGCTRADPGEACVTLLQTRGRMHGKASRFGQAEADLEAALTMQIGLSGEGSARIASQYAYLAEVQRRKGSFAEALASSEKALQLIERHGGAHFGTVGTARLQHAWSNLELGDARAAFDEISIAEPKFAEASPQNVNTRIAMKAVAAAALSRLGRAPEAAAYAREARQLAAPAGIDAESKALLDTVAGGE